ncbi:MAG: ECF transporter S component [Solobacterium sp.]|nr:ECF transporter S component [Solobacterium sp.]
MQTKRIVLTGLMIALGLVLPIAVSFIPNGGTLFSPMHIPALLAGLVLGPVEGLITGVATPLLSHLLRGMPPAPVAPAMAVELGVYGLVGGLCMRMLKDKDMNEMVKLYISLIVAMILGRIAGGLFRGLILNAGEYTLAMWFTSYFVSTVPGMITHLILIPILARALTKAGLTS